jgi:hypothetical protein
LENYIGNIKEDAKCGYPWIQDVQTWSPKVGGTFGGVPKEMGPRREEWI